MERLYAAKVARIARGELTYADTGRINEQASRLDPQWQGGPFNGLDTFHFRFPDQGATIRAAAASTNASGESSRRRSFATASVALRRHSSVTDTSPLGWQVVEAPVAAP
jgi:hypothetical protein